MIDYLKEWVDLSPYIGTPALEGVRFNPKKIDREAFLELAPFGVEPTPELADRLEIYARLLVEWNEKMNLTAITAPDEIVIKHFLPSSTLPTA